MEVTRRKLLAGAAAIPLAGCATPGPGPTPGPDIQQIVQQIIDTVQAWSATVCHIIPTAQSILSVLAGFGVPLTGVGAVVLQAVEQAICQAVPPLASARYQAIPRKASGAAPVVIGPAPTPHGPVVIHGWRT